MAIKRNDFSALLELASSVTSCLDLVERQRQLGVAATEAAQNLERVRRDAQATELAAQTKLGEATETLAKAKADAAALLQAADLDSKVRCARAEKDADASRQAAEADLNKLKVECARLENSCSTYRALETDLKKACAVLNDEISKLRSKIASL